MNNKIKNIINEEIFDFLSEKTNNIEVYHGTDAYFHNFDLNKIGTNMGKNIGGWGIYFSDDPNVSSQYITKNGRVKKYELEYGNFFDLDDYLSSGTGNIILNQLRKTSNISDDDLFEFQNDFINYENDTSNKQAYEWLSHVLGGEKNASLFLSKAGYDGNIFMDKTNPDAKNYVVYNTNIIKYIDKNDEDDLLNEDFGNLMNDLKNKLNKGILTTAMISSLLMSPQLSNAQKQTIKSNFNLEQIDQQKDGLYTNKDIIKLIKNNNLKGEIGSPDEFRLRDIIKSNPNQKYKVFDAVGQTQIASSMTAIAKADTPRHKCFIFNQLLPNKNIKTYVIVLAD